MSEREVRFLLTSFLVFGHLSLSNFFIFCLFLTTFFVVLFSVNSIYTGSVCQLIYL
jgi:hypothetical protein